MQKVKQSLQELFPEYFKFDIPDNISSLKDSKLYKDQTSKTLSDKTKILQRNYMILSTSHDKQAYRVPLSSTISSSFQYLPNLDLENATQKLSNSFTVQNDDHSNCKNEVNLYTNNRRRQSCCCTKCGKNSSKINLISSLYPNTLINKVKTQLAAKALIKVNIVGQSLKKYLSYDGEYAAGLGVSRSPKSIYTYYQSEKTPMQKLNFQNDGIIENPRQQHRTFQKHTSRKNSNVDKSPTSAAVLQGNSTKDRIEEKSLGKNIGSNNNNNSGGRSPKGIIGQFTQVYDKICELEPISSQRDIQIENQGDEVTQEKKQQQPIPKGRSSRKSKTQIYMLKPCNNLINRSKQIKQSHMQPRRISPQQQKINNLQQCKNQVSMVLSYILKKEQQFKEFKDFSEQNDFANIFQSQKKLVKEKNIDIQRMKIYQNLYSNIFYYSNNLNNTSLQGYMKQKLQQSCEENKNKQSRNNTEIDDNFYKKQLAEFKLDLLSIQKDQIKRQKQLQQSMSESIFKQGTCKKYIQLPPISKLASIIKSKNQPEAEKSHQVNNFGYIDTVNKVNFQKQKKPILNKNNSVAFSSNVGKSVEANFTPTNQKSLKKKKFLDKLK